jgi:hypothetical protein
MNKLTAKILIWHAVVLLCEWRLFAVNTHVQFNNVTGLDINLPSFWAFLLTTAMIALGYILFSNEADHAHRVGGHRAFSLTISILVGFLFFVVFGYTWLNLLAVVIFWLCNVWAQERSVSDLKERVKINISRTLIITLMPIVLGFFVMASFVAYQSNFADKIKDNGQLPSQTQIFFRETTDKLFGSKLGPENSTQRKIAVNEAAAVTYKSINDFLHPYFQWAPPLVAFGLFIILWGLSWIFIYASMIVALIVFWVLKKTRVVRIEKKQIEAEVMII